MKSLTSLVDHTLTWGCSKDTRRTHELRFGTELVATLTFPNTFGFSAIAESGEGSWELDRSRYPIARLMIRQKGSEKLLAAYSRRIFHREGMIELDGRRIVKHRQDFWGRGRSLVSESGESLVEMKTRGFFKKYVDVTMNRNALQYKELEGMVILVYYLILLRRREAARHSASGM